MTNSADPDQKPTDLDLHCWLTQGMSCLQEKGYSHVACGASANAAHSNIFSQKIPKYHFVGVCDETYQKVHGHYNLHGES